MKGHWSRVNLVKREALLKDLRATIVLSFPNAKKCMGGTCIQMDSFVNFKAGIRIMIIVTSTKQR